MRFHVKSLLSPAIGCRAAIIALGLLLSGIVLNSDAVVLAGIWAFVASGIYAVAVFDMEIGKGARA